MLQPSVGSLCMAQQLSARAVDRCSAVGVDAKIASLVDSSSCGFVAPNAQPGWRQVDGLSWAAWLFTGVWAPF
jgi:hypothetical protein